MKALIKNIFIGALLLFSGACSQWEMENSKLRSDCYNRNSYSNGSNSSSGKEPPSIIRKDTSLFFSIVRFEDSYDWKQDSSVGRANYRIELYKKNILNFHLDSKNNSKSITSDPDTHHIIYGDLFTQKSSKDSTYISRNGQIILRYKGREILKGLIIEGEDIYTLSSSRSGNGFTYRVNGEIISGHSDGYIMGDMNDASYPETGALYLDGEKKYFCYYTISNSRKRYFYMINGVEKEIDISLNVDDIKIINGKAIGTNCSYLLEDARVWRWKDSYMISGYVKGQFSGVVNEKGQIVKLCSEKAEVLVGRTGVFGVYPTEDGSVVYCSVRMSDDGSTISSKKSIVINGTNEGMSTKAIDERRDNYENSIVISPSCISICEDTPLIALSSREQSNLNCILVGDKLIQLEVNGYVSRIYMTINPPN